MHTHMSFVCLFFVLQAPVGELPGRRAERRVGGAAAVAAAIAEQHVRRIRHHQRDEVLRQLRNQRNDFPGGAALRNVDLEAVREDPGHPAWATSGRAQLKQNEASVINPPAQVPQGPAEAFKAPRALNPRILDP